ncbi:hypothetical protein TTHERM_00384850 (macronuclear) [Tetrahymena thermophila SB210]|uniref:Uncharacterized protein n=1 Tax=Tetrahymena thermophila (strain SB210) TaxID=312017 RepID=Q23RK7_TETTS|nr:hypothetical protein TTHERM_00384850 [Tetrahymena thermophila SB210]EAR99041.2 hypothetical protein TTHERM_00384850 [Tetrahymena thermophila SB210]|eukprot:XP_001019286.2 hypothetical protein TTHERM_00384850 [Tetrahymena thermophila SB210]
MQKFFDHNFKKQKYLKQLKAIYQSINKQMISSFKNLFIQNRINKSVLNSLSYGKNYFFCNLNSQKQDAIMGNQYLLKRIDDNGNIFEVGLFKTKTEAEQRIHEFTINPHKQHYWVEEITKTQAKVNPTEKKSHK